MITSLTKPNRPVFTDLAGLAAMVEDGDRFGVGGHHFARLPIALLRTIAQRGVKDLRYISWAGGLPLELLLEADAVAEIDICFSSLDIFGLPPRFRAAAEAGKVPVRDWAALAMIQALRAAQQNLLSMPFQIPVGSDMMPRIPGAVATADPVSGQPVGAIPALRLDTLVLHAQRADESGNVQILGPKALDLAMVGAARKVLVTVEETVPVGTLAHAGRQTVLTRNQVSAIAVVPGGAWPASCLPFYVTDYEALSEAFAGERGLVQALALSNGADEIAPTPNPSPQGGGGLGGISDEANGDSGQLASSLTGVSPSPLSGGVRGEGNSTSDGRIPAHLRTAAKVTAKMVAKLPPAGDTGQPATTDEVLAVRIAAELGNDSFASAGAVSPLANVAYRLAKATHAPDMILATMSCGHLDVAPSPMILSLIETLDGETAAAHTGGDDTYSTYYQAGAVTHEVVAAAQVDRRGRVNTIALPKPSGGMVRLPGQGGMADVANMHRDYLLYVTRHTPLSVVDAVAIASSARGLLTETERTPYGYRTGKALVFTDLCVFRLDAVSRELVVIETMPGISRERVREATGFDVAFDPHCRVVATPAAEMLEILRSRIDPLGLRRLEFVSAKERGGLIAEILAADRAIVEGLSRSVVEKESRGGFGREP
jgi:glutaconate CoA-transferase, subunit A